MKTTDANSITISALQKTEAEMVSELIRTSIKDYDQSTQVISAILRRIESICQTYYDEGSVYFVARDAMNGNLPVAGAGVGSLHGLPVSEGMGELRDLVVNSDYRGLGLGSKLINTCIEKSRQIGYSKLYLETTPQMKVAQKLFLRTGFRPIHDKNVSEPEGIASYFILENLQKIV